MGTSDKAGDYFYWDGAANANTTAQGSAIGVLVEDTNGSTADALTGKLVTIPPLSESLSYDEAGNLTQDGTWSYIYDGENRLIQMQTLSSSIDHQIPDVSQTFAYDYMGRRASKTVTKWIAGQDVEISKEYYVYTGWTLLAVLNGNGTLKQSFLWSPGGGRTANQLLSVSDEALNKTFFTIVDARGNLNGLWNPGAGEIVAGYEYSPYGEIIRKTGTYALQNPIGWSGQFTDRIIGLDAPDLVYYGLRYYSPRQGRFINRDPITEAGGTNLYAFVGNDPVNRVDVLGLAIYLGQFGGMPFWELPAFEVNEMLDPIDLTALPRVEEPSTTTTNFTTGSDEKHSSLSSLLWTDFILSQGRQPEPKREEAGVKADDAIAYSQSYEARYRAAENQRRMDCLRRTGQSTRSFFQLPSGQAAVFHREMMKGIQQQVVVAGTMASLYAGGVSLRVDISLLVRAPAFPRALIQASRAQQATLVKSTEYGFVPLRNAPGYLNVDASMGFASQATGQMFQRVAIPNWLKIGYGVEKTANFFYSWLSEDPLFTPTPGSAFGSMLSALELKPDFGDD